MEYLEIPAKDDPEFDEALEALAMCANVFRGAFAKVAIQGVDPEQHLEDYRKAFSQAEFCILSWLKHLEKQKMN